MADDADKTIEPINSNFDDVSNAMVYAPKGGKAKDDSFQLTLPLVHYEFEKEIIYQRVKDGYINATAMCNVANRLFGHYNELKTTQAFL